MNNLDINNEEFFMKPKNDYVFKRIFGDERNSDILISFLEAVLKIHIKKVDILNNELPKINIEDKKSILDIRATINDNTQIDVEIQVARIRYMPERSLYYWAKMYCEQLSTSEKYTNLQKTICINIVDFEATEKKSYHSIYRIREEEDNYLLTDLLEIHFLELTKLNQFDDNSKLYNWLNFIKADSIEEVKSMAMADRNIDKAFHILRTMSQSKEERAAYLSREMALHDEATRLDDAKEEGRTERELEIAKNLLDILDDETISLKTGIDIEKIKELRRLNK